MAFLAIMCLIDADGVDPERYRAEFRSDSDESLVEVLSGLNLLGSLVVLENGDYPPLCWLGLSSNI